MSRRLGICLLAFAISSAGCGGTQSPSAQPGPDEVRVSLGSEVVTVTQDGGLLLLTSSAPGRSDAGTRFIPKSAAPQVHYSSVESDLYVFGLAPPGAAKIETDPAGSASVAHGMFLVVIPAQVSPFTTKVHWRFLGSDATVVAEGDGPNS